MPRYDTAFVAKAQELAKQLGMKGSDLFCSLDLERVSGICNGIGPEWMSDKLRCLLDRRFDIAQVPAMIHDVRYQLGDGTKEDFESANDDLETNTRIMSDHLYGWWDFRRYRGHRDARKLKAACQLCGWKAYSEAVESERKAAAEEADEDE